MDNIIARLRSKTTTVGEFNFDNLVAPPLLSLISVDDIMYLKKLATSLKYSSDINFKYSEIDRIMKSRGFVKLSAGTNRVVYRCLENPYIVLKIAVSNVAINDNPREYKNQMFLKPFVSKVFEVSPCGTVAVAERVNNIKSREEFLSMAEDVYELITKWIIGRYVLEDIGTEFFLNWGVREGFGPVLLDYPYMYELDARKLYCQLPLENRAPCDGLIDYDDGFNRLSCSKCGAPYRAAELEKAIKDNLIIEKGKIDTGMKVVVKKGDTIIKQVDNRRVTKKIMKPKR